MFDQAKAAELLFGDTAPKSEPAGNTMLDGSTSPAGTTQNSQPGGQVEGKTMEQHAESLFGGKDAAPEFMPVSDEVKAIRESADRRMFDAQTTYRDALPDDVFKSDQHSAEDSAKAAREVREIAADLDLGPDEFKGLYQRAIDLRVEPLPEADQVAEAINALNARFGNSAKQALRDARLLIERDIRMAKIIEGWGLGNDPHTIVTLAEKARSQIAAGKLKRK